MMKKTLFALGLLALSGSAFAIENGTPLNWSEHDDLVKINCTGTVIAGKWILTAAHCQSDTSGRVEFVNSPVQFAKEKLSYPNGSDSDVDIALWELPTLADTTVTTFLSMREVKENEEIKISGFGAGDYKPLKGLEYAIQTSTPQFVINGEALSRIDLKVNKLGTTLPGDSGAPYTDSRNFIVGVHNGGAFDAETGRQAEGTRLSFARDFILTTINAWHYPTLVTTPTTGGKVTITVQSLHTDTVAQQSPNVISGNVAILPNETDTDCSKLSVEPYGTCTYTFESVDGYEGKVSIGEGQIITINKGRTKSVESVESSKSDSGGSLGFLSLLGLFGTALLRKKALQVL